jgi:hypothetical protein
LCLAVALGAIGTAPVLAKSFSLGAEEKSYLDTAPPVPLQGYGSQYGAPAMNSQTPQYAQPAVHQAGAYEQSRPPLQAQVQKVATLPPGFLGQWQVSGGRTKVEAADPAFQQQAAGAFQMQTMNTWSISGNPGAYQISSDTGVSFQLWVDKVANGVAFVRYQHPVKNTVAQEAIVMQLGNGGATFSGLERISIVKNVPGQAPITRCKVQYQLNGQRMR